VTGRVVVLLAAALLLTACTSTAAPSSPSTGAHSSSRDTSSARATPAASPAARPAFGLADLLPGMPAPLDPTNIYAADTTLSASVRGDLPRVYVPNTRSDTVTVIDPATYRVIGTIRVGHEPQHVVPSWDLRTLWVNDDLGNALTPIDPRTGLAGAPVAVADPYNLYFTPDGRYAVVMASALHRLDFRDAHTMAVHRRVPVPCAGVNHADWTADGRYFLVSCEFSGKLLWVDTAAEKVVHVLTMASPSTSASMGAMPMPQDVKISPDGRRFYVADMQSSGVWVYDVRADGRAPALERFIRTGNGAHGLYVSRDARYLYISNRGEGSISVLRFRDEALVAKWRIPGGGSPDMGNLSADGSVLWLSGRYDGVVYAISTRNGRLLAKIPVGVEPHGLTVWPQPGRYSLGHTGILR